ncbi:MAG: PHP domain-containing protein [Desulfovibrio sp.]|jgi:predicted metal-dependent phosphoesterase TrpH|nr:PHP domain-containing protein [Desulfovibrio sp.]
MTLIDLHTHTSASDGTDSPAELIAKAHAAGLAAVAVTDHNTVAGLDEAEEAGRALNIVVIRGCEISAFTEHGEMHILGLWLPRDLGPLQKRLRCLRAKRAERNVRIVERLRAIGLDVSMEEVRDEACCENVGRTHIAAALLRRGYVGNVREAFSRYLEVQERAYLPKDVMTPEEAVRSLAGLGATVSLAHPMLKKYSAGRPENFVARLAGCGLSALEAWHSEQTKADTRACRAIAERFGLGLSGGSDYHGANKPGLQLGVGYGGLRVGCDVLEGLMHMRRAAGLPCP